MHAVKTSATLSIAVVMFCCAASRSSAQQATIGGHGINGSINIAADQGSSRSLSSTTGSVTTMNGATGFFADVTQQPFVVGFVPLVGSLASGAPGQFGAIGQPIAGFPAGALAPGGVGAVGMASGAPNFGPAGLGTTVLDERLARLREAGGFKPSGDAAMASKGSGSAIGGSSISNNSSTAKIAGAQLSSAGRPAASIAEIRRQQVAADEAATQETKSLLSQGRTAQAAGKIAVARIYYQQAARRATGDLKDEVQAALHSLGDRPASR